MNVIRNHFRRLSNPSWRHAHKSDRLTLIEWACIILVMLLMSATSYGYDTIRMRQEAAESISAANRVLGCLNGNTTLGGEDIHPDGSVWVTVCQRNEVRVRS